MNSPTNILVATDFSDLGQRALDTALTLAEKLDSRIHLVTVVRVQGQTGLEGLTHAAVEDALQRATQHMRSVAQEVHRAGRLGRVITRVGDPARVILFAAEELRADMIVLGSRGRRGLGRLLLGSIAEEVMRGAECPVLVAKLPKPCASPELVPELRAVRVGNG